MESAQEWKRWTKIGGRALDKAHEFVQATARPLRASARKLAAALAQIQKQETAADLLLDAPVLESISERASGGDGPAMPFESISERASADRLLEEVAGVQTRLEREKGVVVGEDLAGLARECAAAAPATPREYELRQRLAEAAARLVSSVRGRSRTAGFWAWTIVFALTAYLVYKTVRHYKELSEKNLHLLSELFPQMDEIVRLIKQLGSTGAEDTVKEIHEAKTQEKKLEIAANHFRGITEKDKNILPNTYSGLKKRIAEAVATHFCVQLENLPKIRRGGLAAWTASSHGGGVVITNRNYKTLTGDQNLQIEIYGSESENPQYKLVLKKNNQGFITYQDTKFDIAGKDKILEILEQKPILSRIFWQKTKTLHIICDRDEWGGGKKIFIQLLTRLLGGHRLNINNKN
jgi:hypothetical protein